MKKHLFLCSCFWFSFFMLQKDKKCFVQKVQTRNGQKYQENWTVKKKTLRKKKMGSKLITVWYKVYYKVRFLLGQMYRILGNGWLPKCERWRCLDYSGLLALSHKTIVLYFHRNPFLTKTTWSRLLDIGLDLF